VFEGDGNGEPPRPDYVFREEAITVGETMLLRPGPLARHGDQDRPRRGRSGGRTAAKGLE
jgi:hypothetical protein